MENLVYTIALTNLALSEGTDETAFSNKTRVLLSSENITTQHHASMYKTVKTIIIDHSSVSSTNIIILHACICTCIIIRHACTCTCIIIRHACTCTCMSKESLERTLTAVAT